MNGVIMYNRAGIQTHDVQNAAFVNIETEAAAKEFIDAAYIAGVPCEGIYGPGKYVLDVGRYDEWSTFDELTELYLTALAIF